ncbi:MAG: hypothetical protein KAR80_04825 [Rhodospirillaceae bacterium]|nr:hypothetical protein [Rhodospirillaceae bacterium]
MNNSANKKPLWPQTPEGTTDWDVVFEDPTNGFIAIISQAKTPEALRQTTELVIKKLFTRDDDGPEVARFCNELDQIISLINENDQLAATVDAVAGLLRSIKNERKEKAREYLENKKKGSMSGERRSRRKKNTLAAKIFRGLLVASDPKIAIPIILLLMAVVVTAVIYFTSPQKKMPPREVSAAGQQNQQAPSAEENAPIITDEAPTDLPTANEGDAPSPEDEAGDSVSKWPRAVLLQPMQWPLIRESKKDRLIPYATLIYVKSAKAISAVCINYPAVKEKLLISFSRAGLGNRQPSNFELKKIAATATNAINKRIGPMVAYIDIIQYGKKGYRATNTPPCRLAR